MVLKSGKLNETIEPSALWSSSALLNKGPNVNCRTGYKVQTATGCIERALVGSPRSHVDFKRLQYGMSRSLIFHSVTCQI